MGRAFLILLSVLSILAFIKILDDGFEQLADGLTSTESR